MKLPNMTRPGRHVVRLIIAVAAAVFVGLAGGGSRVAAGASVGASVSNSPTRFVAYLGRQPIDLPKSFTVAYDPSAYVRGPVEQGRPQPPPQAVGVVSVGIHSPCCRGVGIQYTVYPDAKAAREWLFGPEPTSHLSIWRLKQLGSSSLPHPRLAGRVPRYPTTSVIVESAGHLRLDRMGLTEADVLVGNVITNVTTYSRTSTQHGNRVATMQLLEAAVSHLRRTQVAFGASR